MPWTRVHRLVIAGSILWCCAIIATPVFDVHVVYEFFSRICHQNPGRSWHIFGTQLPVCIRCTSIYFGFLFGALRIPRPDLKALKTAGIATLCEFALAQLLLDSPWLRAGTGLGLGIAVAPFFITGVEEMLQQRFRRFNGATRDAM